MPMKFGDSGEWHTHSKEDADPIPSEGQADFEHEQDEEGEAKEKRAALARNFNKQQAEAKNILSRFEFFIDLKKAGLSIDDYQRAVENVRQISQHTYNIPPQSVSKYDTLVKDLNVMDIMLRLKGSTSNDWNQKPAYFRALAIAFANHMEKK